VPWKHVFAEPFDTKARLFLVPSRATAVETAGRRPPWHVVASCSGRGCCYSLTSISTVLGTHGRPGISKLSHCVLVARSLALGAWTPVPVLCSAPCPPNTLGHDARLVRLPRWFQSSVNRSSAGAYCWRRDGIELALAIIAAQDAGRVLPCPGRTGSTASTSPWHGSPRQIRHALVTNYRIPPLTSRHGYQVERTRIFHLRRLLR